MLSFKELSLRNFLSFGANETIVDLNTMGSTLIIGENVDTSSNNGAGKSTILGGISFALYNKTLENISKDKMINKTNHTKTTLMEVSLTFTRDDKEIKIYRSRGSSSSTILTEDGIDITPDSVDHVNKKIVELVGLSFDLFSRLIMFRGSDTPFLDLPVASQRLTIEELFNITLLTEKALLLKEKNKQTELDITILQTLIKSEEQAKSLHEKQLKEAEDRILKWESEKELSIAKLDGEIQKLLSIDFDKELLKIQDIKDLSILLDGKKDEKVSILDKKKPIADEKKPIMEEKKILSDQKKIVIAEIEILKIDKQKIIDKSKKINNEILLLEKDIERAEKDEIKVTHELTHLTSTTGAICPFCSQEIKNAEQLAKKIDDLSKNKEKNKEDMVTLLTLKSEKVLAIESISTDDIEDKINNTSKGLLKFDSPDLLLDERLLEIDKKLGGLENDIEVVELSIKGLEKQISDKTTQLTYKNEIEIIKVQSSDAQLKIRMGEIAASVNPHTEAYISILSSTVKEIEYDKLNIFKKELEHQKFLLKLLVDNNSFVRRKIIQKTIPFMNTRLNEYTSHLGLPHIVKFDTDMTASVLEYGRELDFGNLSSGEKKRVNLALSLAFRDVYHHIHEKIDILFFDEPDGGSMDPSGVDALIKLLKKKSRDENIKTFVIMHRPECSGRFDREMTVKKQGGFSSISVT